MRSLPLWIVMVFVAACSNQPSGFLTELPPTDATGAPEVRPIETGTPDAGATVLDGSGVYDVPAPPNPGTCGTTPTPCPMPRRFGCLDREICNNGTDDDCNGRVDETCPCAVGQVQRCFLGPPDRRGVGACQDGMQTCQGNGEFGCWSPCTGGIAPAVERCDNADNDCNGCADDGLCCMVRAGSCPSGDDPRTPVGRPFQDYRLRARDFYTANTSGATFRWRVSGGPCDQMLFATSGQVTYTLNNNDRDSEEALGENLIFRPSLSGDYTIRLIVMSGGSVEFDCTFVVKIRAPGLRAELCWDRTGVTDIDLWMHRPDNEDAWVSNNDSTCYYQNCRNDDTGRPNWGFSATPGTSCNEPVSGGCNNPRLDLDNVSDVGIPENINVDNPRDGQNFRVAVNFYGGRDGAVQPMLNVYCGGELRATYGGVISGSRRFGSVPVEGFDTGGTNEDGSLWRVVDVRWRSAGGVDGCELTPLVKRGSTNHCVETNTDRSYNGGCERRMSTNPGSMGGVCM